MMNARLNLLTLYPSLLAPLLFADFVFEYLDRSTGTKTRAASLEEAFHFLTRMDAASGLHLDAGADVFGDVVERAHVDLGRVLDALDFLNSDNPVTDAEEEAFRRRLQRKKKKRRGPRL